MQSVGDIGFDLRKFWVVYDGLRALPRFFSRLEKQHYFALVGTLFAESSRQSTEDGGMAIVTAFVRNALVL